MAENASEKPDRENGVANATERAPDRADRPDDGPKAAGQAQGRRKLPPNVRILDLTMLFMGTGLLLFLIAMIYGGGAAAEVARLSLRSPQGLFAAHLMLPGFATMIAMGASFQLTQVILNTSLYSRALGFAHYAVYLAGLLLLVAGFLFDARWIGPGGTAAFLGSLMYAFNLIMTVLRKKAWNLFVFGIGLSLAALMTNLAFGVAMGIGYLRRWPSGWMERLFEGHLWLGLGGWLAGLILVFSFKLLPMFYVSRKKWSGSSWAIVGAFHFGVWWHALIPWTGLERLAVIGDIAMLAAWGWFVFHNREVRRLSSGKHPVGAVKIAYGLIPAIGLVFLARCLAEWEGRGSSRLEEALGIAIVLGWFAPTILGYLSKIFPFLWWALRFHTRWGKKPLMQLSDMLPERRMTRELAGYLAGVAVLMAGHLAGAPALAAAGQALALAFAIVYLAELMRVFRH